MQRRLSRRFNAYVVQHDRSAVLCRIHLATICRASHARDHRVHRSHAFRPSGIGRSFLHQLTNPGDHLETKQFDVGHQVGLRTPRLNRACVSDVLQHVSYVMKQNTSRCRISASTRAMTCAPKSSGLFQRFLVHLYRSMDPRSNRSHARTTEVHQSAPALNP